MPVRIRRAQRHEAPAIELVLAEAFAEFLPLYTAEAFAATTPNAKELVARWAEGPVWIALDDVHTVGTVGASLSDSGLYVRSMAILPRARGLGIGHRLLEKTLSFAARRALQRVYLSTTPFLLDAIRLYEQNGFARTADGPHELHGTPLVTMERWFTPPE